MVNESLRKISDIFCYTPLRIEIASLNLTISGQVHFKSMTIDQ